MQARIINTCCDYTFTFTEENLSYVWPSKIAFCVEPQSFYNIVVSSLHCKFVIFPPPFSLVKKVSLITQKAIVQISSARIKFQVSFTQHKHAEVQYLVLRLFSIF